MRLKNTIYRKVHLTVAFLALALMGQAQSESSEPFLHFRVEGNYLHHRDKQDGDWNRFIVKGVNLGVALPGKFPGEFAMSYQQYYSAIADIACMNANVIRIYTILPPEFYRALADYNSDSVHAKVYLMQGIWATDPKEGNYRNPKFTGAFIQEAQDAINVLHGNAQLRKKPGKAHGNYTADISRYVCGIILGREWEPASVHRTNQKYDEPVYHGDYIHVNRGNATESWLASVMDQVIHYQANAYGLQQPISFVNWLPLDPMYHSSEIIENDKVREYDNDLETLDFIRFHPSPDFKAGIFASYHAYPYYPDFIYNDERYRKHKKGSNHYAAYLEHLKSHHQNMPLIIAEYGLPSSRGNSHISPHGLSQGGHSEKEHARKNLGLTRDIFQSGCAGAIFFEWQDEWFKHNWLTMPFEKPAERIKLWHNAENPEQNFGIVAVENRTKVLDGKLDDWEAPELGARAEFNYGLAADGTFLYFTAEFQDEERFPVYLALDLVPGKAGDHRLPFTEEKYEAGFEFLLEFHSRDSARLLVDEPYSVYTDRYSEQIPDYRSVENDNGRFIPQKMLSNRSRTSLSGEKFGKQKTNRSKLKHGESDSSRFSNADWYMADDGKMELRIPWALLNVTDPTQGRVLQNDPDTETMDFIETEGIQIWAFGLRRDSLQMLHPESKPLRYAWKKYHHPEYSLRKKPLYNAFQEYFRSLKIDDSTASSSQFTAPAEAYIAPFYNNHRGAVSLAFDQTALSQIKTALPVLNKYYAKATFSLPYHKIPEDPWKKRWDCTGRHARMGSNELKYLFRNGHQPAFRPLEKIDSLASVKMELSARYRADFHVLHEDTIANFKGEYSFPFHRKIGQFLNENFAESGIKYRSLYASVLRPKQLRHVLRNNRDSWLLLNYEYLYENEPPDNDTCRFIGQRRFDRQVRMARNFDFWLTTEWNAFAYQRARGASEVSTKKVGALTLIRAQHYLDQDLYDHPLTVIVPCKDKLVEVKGSLSDGFYLNRRGFIQFDMLPGQVVSLLAQ